MVGNTVGGLSGGLGNLAGVSASNRADIVDREGAESGAGIKDELVVGVSGVSNGSVTGGGGGKRGRSISKRRKKKEKERGSITFQRGG